MSRTDPPLKIRLPELLKAKVKAASEAGRRSMNSEIVARLEASFEQEEMAGVPDFTRPDPLEKIRAEIAALKADVAALKAKA